MAEAKIPKSKSPKVNTSQICEHIAEHGTIYTPDVVKGVIEKFIQCFRHLLLDGHKLKLDGLGTFYLSISTIGAESDLKFTPANIKSVRVKFVADKSDASGYRSDIITKLAQFTDIATVVDPSSLVYSSTGGTGSGSGSGTDEPIENRP